VIGNTGKLALVVWIDEPDVPAPRTIGGDPPIHGEFQLKDGRKLAWNCSSRDGETGKVEIAGLPHDLEKGGLFLVSTKEGGTKVEQQPLRLWAAQSRAQMKSLRASRRRIPKSPRSLTLQWANSSSFWLGFSQFLCQLKQGQFLTALL
jgi:hypothetical protein